MVIQSRCVPDGTLYGMAQLQIMQTLRGVDWVSVSINRKGYVLLCTPMFLSAIYFLGGLD